MTDFLAASIGLIMGAAIAVMIYVVSRDYEKCPKCGHKRGGV